MAEESVAQMETEPVVITQEEAPAKKTRGRKKKEAVAAEPLPEPVVVPETVAVPEPEPEPVVPGPQDSFGRTPLGAEKPKAKRKPRAAKVSATVVDVVPVDTPQSLPDGSAQREQTEEHNQMVDEDPVEDATRTWQELQRVARVARKQEKNTEIQTYARRQALIKVSHQ